MLALSQRLTLGLVVAVIAMIADPSGPLGVVGAAYATSMFVLGCVTNVMAFARAISRSRTEVVEVSSIWFPTGSVMERGLRRQLHGATIAQFVIGVIGAGVRPFTLAAFGVLAFLAGMGLTGLCSARYGVFPDKPERH